MDSAGWAPLLQASSKVLRSLDGRTNKLGPLRCHAVREGLLEAEHAMVAIKVPPDNGAANDEEDEEGMDGVRSGTRV